jgi:uncharacterized protein (DUF1697 family)
MVRGINVSGQKKIRMDELKAVYESLGFDNVRTYIQSGNVVFDSDLDEKGAGEKIRKKIVEAFGFPVPVTLRSTAAIKQVIRNNPFLADGIDDIKILHVTFLSQAPSLSTLDQIDPATGGDDQFRFSDSHEEIYIRCPNGYGRTKLTNTFFEKQLGVSATTRNWNTVNKLYEIASPSGL